MAIEPYPASFQARMVQANGSSLYVRFGGNGPAVVLLHGFGDTGDMWAPLAAALVSDRTVVVPGLYAKPNAMHDAFEQFGAFSQDAVDNKALLASCGKISMPVLAVGGEKSFGSAMADELRFVADNVTTGIVPASGHWIMEENPQATIQLVTGFIGA